MADRYFEVSLQRNGSDVPWGFRLTENARFPTVVRVNPNGVATRIIEVGDLVLKIGQNFTEGRSYDEVLQMIKNEGNDLHLTIDRGGASPSLWSSTTSTQESVTSPIIESGRHIFGGPPLKSNESGNPKPFTYSSAPNQLAEELQMRHDAMRKERKQNLANTTAVARSRMAATDQTNVHQRQMGNKAVMAAMPRFTMSDPKDFTKSDVYRLLDEEEGNAERQMRNLQVTSPPPTMAQPTFAQPGPSCFANRQLSTGSTNSNNEQTVRFDDNVTQYNVSNDDDEDDNQMYGVADYHQKSIRYLGRNIPSKTFKMLQSLIGDEESQNGQAMAPATVVDGPKTSMRSIKSRAAQRRQAGSGQPAARANYDAYPAPVNEPTSPQPDMYRSHNDTPPNLEQRRTSFTDF